MRSKEKCCFIFWNGKASKEFCKELQKRLGTVVKESDDYAGYKMVYVDMTVYERALRVGTKIMVSNLSYMQYGGWVDYYNGIYRTNLGIAMYGFLQNCNIDKFWADEVLSVITEFKTKLSESLGKEVYITCNTTYNAINVQVAPMDEHRTIKRDVKKFMKDHDTPFEKVVFCNYVGKLIQ